MKRFLLYIAILSIIISAPIYANSSNLVLNPGFEEREGTDTYYWTTGSWEEKGSFRLDTAQSRSGQASILITNDLPTDSRCKQQIAVKANTYYRLSCWIKTENVGTDTKGVNLSVEGLTDTSADFRGTSSDWNYTELYGLTGKDQQSLILTLGLGGYGSLNTGKAWFDDVSVEEMKEPPSDVNVIKLYKADTPYNNSSHSGYSLLMILIAMALIWAFVYYFIKKEKSRVKTPRAKPVCTFTSSISQPFYLK